MTTKALYEQQYEPIDFVENLERYRPGGYHPLVLGDKLKDGRYTIMSKLGWGGFSTVWFARDEQQQQFVSVKVVIAASSATEERRIRELLDRAQESRLHRWLCLVPRFVDAFSVQGPNGMHDCLVSAAGGESLLTAKEYPVDFVWLFPLEVARALAAQMILAVSFVHAQGIVHGDLHLGNFLLQLPQSVLSFSKEEYLRTYQPTTEPILRWDGKPLPPSAPSYAVPEYGIGEACHLLTLADAAGILLTDFGSAWLPAEKDQFTLTTLPAHLPPEHPFARAENKPLGPSADVWSLAHALYGLFDRSDLFKNRSHDQHDAFAQAIELLGRPPAPWWDSWTARGEFFDTAGNWEVQPSRSAPCGGPLHNRIEKMCLARREFDAEAGITLSEDEKADLEDMLSCLLTWSPSTRIRSEELIQCPWMRNWGLPAMEQAQKAARH